MSGLNWTCPHCLRAVVITEERSSASEHCLWINNADGPQRLLTRFFVCPNVECRKFTLLASLQGGKLSGHEFVPQAGIPPRTWNLVPDTRSKVFPSYIPVAVLEDYREACTIRDLSPKASATLSRRCLQGIIRDFWGARPARLIDEINEIKPLIDGATWGAIDAVRKIGNIGAHMEKDINVIVDVEPQEAELLIQLIETLLTEWYVARADRTQRMAALVAAAASKKPAGVAPAPPASTPNPVP